MGKQNLTKKATELKKSDTNIVEKLLKKVPYIQKTFLNDDDNVSEEAVDSWFGSPKFKGAEMSILNESKDYKGPYPFNDRDQARHTQGSQFTTESLRRKLGILGNTFPGRIAAVAGANILGFAHEYKAGWDEASKEDMINNFRGTMVGGFGDVNLINPVESYVEPKGNFNTQTERIDPIEGSYAKNLKIGFYNQKISEMLPDGHMNRADPSTDIYKGDAPDYNSPTLADLQNEARESLRPVNGPQPPKKFNLRGINFNL